MCTAISWLGKHHFFGRNLDLEYAYQECVAITPRNFPFSFRSQKPLDSHYAMIGTATVVGDYPLYYEATNEAGLSIAGLNFPGNAAYLPVTEGKDNITPFELIPWILGQCADVAAARELIAKINIVNIPFSDAFPLSPLHWIIADRQKSIVVEAMEDGVHVHEDPVGVLTNNPPFPYHMHNLSNYMGLSAHQIKQYGCMFHRYLTSDFSDNCRDLPQQADGKYCRWPAERCAASWRACDQANIRRARLLLI